MVISVLIFVAVVLHPASSRPVGWPNPLSCGLCEEAVSEIRRIIELNSTFEEVYPLAVDVCEVLLGKAHIDGKYICPGIISGYGPPIQFVGSQIILDPTTICQDLNICPPSSNSTPAKQKAGKESLSPSYGKTRGGKLSRLSQSDFSLPAWGSKFPSVGNRSAVPLRELPKKKPVRPDAQSKTITFLQLTDIHFDAYYAEGSPTDCNIHFCCRSWYHGNGSAGHYGDYHCDLPTATLDLLADEILKLDPAPDFIIYTGDNPPHDMWNQSYDSQLQATKTIVDFFHQRMPTITIYPSIGNHETWPESEFYGILPEYQSLTRNLSITWKKWVELSPEAEASIAHGGYYSAEVMKGLRIISFNSNYGYLLNFYSFLNADNRLYWESWSWLDAELSAARRRGEKVLLIEHIPPGDGDNQAEYGQLYLNVTKYFKDIIVGHLAGHTHMDQFQLIQDEKGVYGVVLVAPSVTPFGHINPSFRTYTMDAENMRLLDYTQFHLDLPLANDLYAHGSKGEVHFVPSYTTREEYNLTDLTPSSYGALSKRFQTDSGLLNRYSYNRYGRSKEQDKVCDIICRKNMLCEVNNIISTNRLACQG